MYAIFTRAKRGGSEKDDAAYNRSVSQLESEEGISEATLYIWRKEGRAQGILIPKLYYL